MSEATCEAKGSLGEQLLGERNSTIYLKSRIIMEALEVNPDELVAVALIT